MSAALLGAAVLVAIGSLAPVRRAAAQGLARPALVSLADTTLDPSVAREIERAAARGIPVEPLLAKAREGRLKRAVGPRIRMAVAALATRLDSARAALGPTASVGELVAGADALAAGADATAVREVLAASLIRPASVPLGALAQLVASGVPSPRAATLIVGLMRRQATPAQVIAFGNSVEADAAGGLPADEAATFRWREFSTGTGGSATALSAPSLPADASEATGRPATGPSSPTTKTPRRRP